MTDDVRISFASKILELCLSEILPLRKIPPQILASRKYARIVASLDVVGWSTEHATSWRA